MDRGRRAIKVAKGKREARGNKPSRGGRMSKTTGHVQGHGWGEGVEERVVKTGSVGFRRKL